MEIGETGFGGGEGFFFLAEGEAHLGGAVLGVVVEAGAWDAGYADILYEIFRERDVAGFGGIFGLVEMEAGNVRHDVVGAARPVHGEAGIFENAKETCALFIVCGGEIVVIRLRQA